MNGSIDLGYLTTSVEFHAVNNCPWCHSSELTHLATRGDGLEVKRCAACHLGFLASLPDDLSVFYDASYFARAPGPGTEPPASGYEHYERAYTALSFRWLTSLIGAIKPDRGRLFDFGAATGSFLDMARYEGFVVSGSELTAAGTSAARAKGLDVKEGFFASSDWDGHTFDVVTAFEILEHVTDIRSTLIGLRDILSDEGVLVFTVPNVSDDIVDTYGDGALDFNKSLEHTLYFNPNVLVAIFEEIFGANCLTLHTAESSVWGQPVSSALGIVRVSPSSSDRENVLVDAISGTVNMNDLVTAEEAIAVALSAARFSEPAVADLAVKRARDLGASPNALATVEAQVLRNRGEIHRAFRTLELSATSGISGQDSLSATLMTELFDDLTVILGIDAAGFAEGLERMHERLGAGQDLYRALAAARADAGEDFRNLSDLDWIGKIQDALVEERHRTRQAELEARDLQYLFAESEIDRIEAVERADELQNQVDTYVQRLYDIHHSRMWKIWSLVWRIKGILTRRPPEKEDEEVDLKRPVSKRDRTAGPHHVQRVYPVSVSVIMPVYNKGDSIRASITSVLAQTFSDVEIVVWDDGSTDTATMTALDDIEALESVSVTRARNQGVVGARNSAMQAANGEFFVCLDPDDLFEPTYIEKAVVYLRSHPDIAIVYPWQRTIGDKAEVWETHELDPIAIVDNNHVPVCAVFRREVFEATGGFSEEMAAGYEDWEFWAHAASLGFKGRAIPEPLFEYHYSTDPTKSRDAEARAAKTELAGLIRSRHSPSATETSKQPHKTVHLPRWIEPRIPSYPEGTGRPVVLMLPWFTVGGADKVVETLVSHWKAAGRTVVVVTTLGVDSGMDNRLSDLLARTSYVYELPNYLPRHLWYPFVRSIVSSLGDPAILNIGSTWFYEYAARLKADLPNVRIIDQQFNDSGHVAGNRMASGVIDTTVTAYRALQRSIDEHGVSPMTTIYVGIEPRRVTLEQVNGVRQDLGLDENEQFASFVGRLSEEKRPDWIIPLADELLKHGHRIVVIGSGPLTKKYRRRFEQHPAIVWRRNIDNPDALFAGSAVTVLPSRIEGIPLTAMESLAAGTPVVATAVGGLPELSEVPGIHLVPVDDQNAFVETVIRVIAAPPSVSVELPEWLSVDNMLRAYDEVVTPY